MIKPYTVQGMTCGHCVSSVSEEIGHHVGVDLVTGAVTVERETPIEESAIESAVEEAGHELVR